MEEILKKTRNQIVGIVVATMMSGIGMNCLFIYTINRRVDDIQAQTKSVSDKLENHLYSLIKISQ